MADETIKDPDIVENPDEEQPTEPIEPVEPTEPDEPQEPIEPAEPEEPAQEDEFLNWDYQTIPDFYNRVRGALNVGNAITDTVIDYFENAPMAEMKIKQCVPKWKELNDMKKMLFDTCIIYMTCYALCPLISANRIKKMKDTTLELDYAINTNDKPCARFIELVEDLLAQINDEERPPFFYGFKVTSPERPRCCRPLRYPTVIMRPDCEDMDKLEEKPDTPVVPDHPEPGAPENPDEETNGVEP